jgi:prepilin-type N-terminal cleavage/methylation domain-containing protein
MFQLEFGHDIRTNMLQINRVSRMCTKILQGREKGFTLIELLIVCVILGTLAAAVIPNVGAFAGNAAVGAANQELASIESSLTGYIADNGEFPCAIQPTVGNPQPLAADLIQEYLGNAPIKGKYVVDIYGHITGDPADPYPGLIWDASLGRWVR